MGTITRPDSTTRGLHRRPGAGLDQQRHVGQPGRGDPAGQAASDLHRPQRQHDHAPARLVRPGHDRASRSTPRQRRDQRPQFQRPAHRHRSTRSTGSPSSRYDSHGQHSRRSTPTSNNDQYTYNSDSEPLTYANANSNTTYVHVRRQWQPDGHPGPAQQPDDDDLHVDRPGPDSRRMPTSYTTTYQYDSQDRVTTIQFPTARPTEVRVQLPGQRDQASPTARQRHDLQLRRPEPRDRDDRRAERHHDIHVRRGRQPDQGPGADPGRPDGSDDNVCL